MDESLPVQIFTVNEVVFFSLGLSRKPQKMGSICTEHVSEFYVAEHSTAGSVLSVRNNGYQVQHLKV